MNKVITIGIAIVVSTFVASNAILLFSDKSEIKRTYYVHEYDRVHESTYTKELEKESVVVPTNEMTVTVDVDAISDIVVTEGDMVQEGTELATLNTQSADAQRAQWESEQQAYTEEQSQLHEIMDNLESERYGAGSNSTSNQTAGNDETTVNVQVDVNVSPEGNFSQAIAETEQKIAEIDRKLKIVSTQLSQNSGETALLSPIEGNIATIEERNGSYFITIYANEKSVITYAKEDEWHQINEGQRVNNYSAHREGVVEGTVFAKTQVPANESKWLKAYKQFGENPNEPVYEVQIQLEEQLESLPFSANINSVLITNEAENAVRVKANWLLNRSDETAEVYTLSADGKIMRAQVTVPFDLKKHAILSEGLQNDSIVLNGDPKTEEAPAFLPFPRDLPSWNSIKAIGWKDYARYLTYK
ncbi:efflux RND transporter periplasmic adaptor subunit [Psychrobacillus sp. NEAU-3TGS]|uniref:efflux RND transporter periplasmic adaptor subunit n=1 Tax=Psychrobacillus sp. NEAU-3TGS TaxID=2995412 RepID=UPI0024971FE9|nr:efflux RND transporter periplasmic adaptor subunit [Psychrobacillus sp. NEAU-3TGS]MDI2587724.1 efflux RND transporter periplasmic adaptor subunit [Psychrobacillus sp. NEAU-3TGS]